MHQEFNSDTIMIKTTIIGRQKEIERLYRLYNSDKSEFVAIYGRRRVGKSFLVDEAFKDRIVFNAVGVYIDEEELDEQSYRQKQLSHFYSSLLDYGLPTGTPKPLSWEEAFRLLRQILSKKRNKRKVVFLDELPWMAGPQSSEFVSELGHFWNYWACKQRNIVLVVCGSATSWMLDNVIHDYGGLHGRLTDKFQLFPFSLKECEEYFKLHNFRMSRYEIALSYMVIGGIPYYMDLFRNDYTLAENIDEMFFANDASKQEFKDVYVGLFKSSEKYIDIVKVLGKHFYGQKRSEIAAAIGMKTGGGLSKMIENLKLSGIIREYTRYGGERKESVYQLTDFFSLFYLRFIEGNSVARRGSWRSLQRTPAFFAWAGNSFELLCIIHQQQLCDKLRIVNMTDCYCWRGKASDGSSAQIDLLIEWHGERTDYLCEMKFSENKYTITKELEEDLLNRVDAFMISKQRKPSHSLQVIMVTTLGLRDRRVSTCVNNEVVLDDLFAS